MNISFILQSPINASIAGMVIIFIISAIVLYLTKPNFITVIPLHGEDREKKKNYMLIFTYSLLFAFSIGIVIMMTMSGLLKQGGGSSDSKIKHSTPVKKTVYHP